MGDDDETTLRAAGGGGSAGGWDDRRKIQGVGGIDGVAILTNVEDFRARYAALVIVLSDALELPPGRRGPDEIVAAIEALRERADCDPCKSCGADPSVVPKTGEELPIVMGALDAQARAEKALYAARKLAQAATTDRWVVLYKPEGIWWRADRTGYTRELLSAGVYTEAEAKACACTRGPQANGLYLDEAMPLSDALDPFVRGGEGTVIDCVASEFLAGHFAAIASEVLDPTWTKNPAYETLGFEDYLGHLAEECAEFSADALEVVRVVGKILRFGLDAADPAYPDETNRSALLDALPNLAREGADMRLAAARMLAKLEEWSPR